jgi:hypothetical protein
MCRTMNFSQSSASPLSTSLKCGFTVSFHQQATVSRLDRSLIGVSMTPPSRGSHNCVQRQAWTMNVPGVSCTLPAPVRSMAQIQLAVRCSVVWAAVKAAFCRLCVETQSAFRLLNPPVHRSECRVVPNSISDSNPMPNEVELLCPHRVLSACPTKLMRQTDGDKAERR